MASFGSEPRGLRRLPLYKQLQSLICSYIAENNLQAGDPIPSEGEWAEAFGVARNSVREAVKSLQVLGVLVSRPGTGLFVGEFSFDPIVESLPYAILVDRHDLVSLLEVRQLLEVGMAGRIVEARTDAQLRRLRGIVESWKAELTKRADAYPEDLDRAFHEELGSEVQNILVVKLLDMFWQVFYRAASRGELIAPRDPRATLDFHISILNALEDGSVDMLSRSLILHYEGIGARVRAAAAKALGGDGGESADTA